MTETITFGELVQNIRAIQPFDTKTLAVTSKEKTDLKAGSSGLVLKILNRELQDSGKTPYILFDLIQSPEAGASELRIKNGIQFSDESFNVQKNELLKDDNFFAEINSVVLESIVTLLLKYKNLSYEINRKSCEIEEILRLF